ncbi:MAG: 50S ribosomal protein L28 [Elusimicrobiota bacterium]
MSFKCVKCGKKPVSGNTISHSHHSTKRTFVPNLQKVKILWEGRHQRALVCTRCLRSGFVQKAVNKPRPIVAA